MYKPRLKWTNRYNYHSLNLNNLLTIHVDWLSYGDRSGYEVKYGNLKVKGLIPNLEEAKRIAIRNVGKHLVKLCADLSTMKEN